MEKKIKNHQIRDLEEGDSELKVILDVHLRKTIYSRSNNLKRSKPNVWRWRNYTLYVYIDGGKIRKHDRSATKGAWDARMQHNKMMTDHKRAMLFREKGFQRNTSYPHVIR